MKRLRRLLRLRPPRSVRVRITLVAALITAAAMTTGGWLFIRSVEGSELGEIRQDNEELFDLAAAELRDGTEPACLPETIPVDKLTTAQVEVVDEAGVAHSFTATYSAVGGMNVRRSVSTPDGRPPDGAASVECCLDPAGQPRATGCDLPVPVTDVPDPCGHGPVDGQVGVVEGTTPPPPEEPNNGTTCLVEGTTSSSDEGGGVESPEGTIEHADAGGGPLVGLASDEVADASWERITKRVSTPTEDLTLTVATPVDQVTESIRAVKQGLLVGLPLAIGLVAAVSWLLVGRALRPVEAIRAEADAIGGRTLDRRLPEPGTGDEVGRLAGTMNAMLARLEAAARRQRQFVADASHELRSPLAAIRTDLEVALLEGDQADWREAVRASLREEARLEALIDDLLVLASDDENASSLPDTEVDLAGLAQAEADTARRAEPAPVLDVITSKTGARTRGSERQLQRVVRNLVDNAARHAASQVRIAVEGVGDDVRLTVDDDGPGIPEADREWVFERFTRLDDGRARDDGGAGLGLAVVRSIVTRHGGTVHIEDSDLGGARLVVTLPTLARQ